MLIIFSFCFYKCCILFHMAQRPNISFGLGIFVFKLWRYFNLVQVSNYWWSNSVLKIQFFCVEFFKLYLPHILVTCSSFDLVTLNYSTIVICSSFMPNHADISSQIISVNILDLFWAYLQARPLTEKVFLDWIVRWTTILNNNVADVKSIPC